MTNVLLRSTALALFGIAGFSSAAAQESGGADQPTTGHEQQAQQTGEQPPIIAVADWNYDQIYANGWSLERLIDDARVFGIEGEEIGDVENVLIGADGKILAVIAEVGGFLDIGDTHVSVPWEQVSFSPALDLIEVPVNEDNVDDYSLFGEWGYYTKTDAEATQVVNDDLLTGPRVWKASEVLDDYALLTGDMAFGYVEDLIFTNDGSLHAVVVEPDAAYAGGPYAFPYYGYSTGWHPGSPYYALPYGEEEVAVIDTFDFDRLSDDIAMQGAGDPAEQPATTGSVETEDLPEETVENGESAN